MTGAAVVSAAAGFATGGAPAMLSRSRSPRDRSGSVRLPDGVDVAALAAATDAAVESLFIAAKLKDPAHNMQHVREVTSHVKEATRAEPLGPLRDAVVLLAAILHEADDSKLFKTSVDDENARRILAEVLPAEWDGAMAFTEIVVEVIGLVSARKNKHGGVPENEEWKLIVRDADRLEAIGEVGIARCYAYNQKVGTPTFLETTPRARTAEELWKIATDERFAAYQDSVSMVDHFYDKLLHLAKCSSGNAYLRRKMDGPLQALVDFCLDFGEKGTVDVDRCERLKEKYCSGKKP